MGDFDDCLKWETLDHDKRQEVMDLLWLMYKGGLVTKEVVKHYESVLEESPQRQSAQRSSDDSPTNSDNRNNNPICQSVAQALAEVRRDDELRKRHPEEWARMVRRNTEAYRKLN